MKLAVFGGSGRSGRPLIEQALAAGHQVTALVRDPARLARRHAQLIALTGDILNPADVDRTVRAAEAVISVIGHGTGSPPDLQQRAGRHIVDAMRTHVVRRLIALTGAGVRAPQDQPKFFDHFMRGLLGALQGTILRDSEAYADIIRTSGLDWTLVRGPMLTEGPARGQYRVGWAGVNAGPRIARADLADFMLKQLTSREYVGKAPVVSD